MVPFTARSLQSMLSVSSSGGGLFGRPATHASLGRFLIFRSFATLPGFPIADAISTGFGYYGIR